jgi:A/G-specific adenine glycosylase
MRAAFRKSLVEWYRANARNLPWRVRPTPYHVWVSEIMLQQTRVEVVREYFTRFIRRFPSLRKLAAANIEDVLQAWSGLGYYRRARMLHAAAREIVQRHRGRFPAVFEDVIALPGIGRYTAGAILSIAFNQPRPIVDGNVQRVFARLTASNGDAWPSAEEHVVDGRAEGLPPAELNQALMELGAMICTPRAPRCSACPVRRHCRALKTDAVADHPAPKARARVREQHYLFAAVRDVRNRVLLVRREENDNTSLLPGGLWELPHTPHSNGALGELSQVLGIELKAAGAPGTRRHSVMNFRLQLTVQPCTAEGTPDQGKWFTPGQASDAAIASATRKLLDALQTGR